MPRSSSWSSIAEAVPGLTPACSASRAARTALGAVQRRQQAELGEAQVAGLARVTAAQPALGDDELAEGRQDVGEGRLVLGLDRGGGG